MKELSRTQAELLAAIEAGTELTYHPYMGRFRESPFYTRSDTWKKCTKEANALLERGLVAKVSDSWRSHSVVSLARAKEMQAQKDRQFEQFRKGVAAAMAYELPDLSDGDFKTGYNLGESIVKEWRPKFKA